MTWRETCRAKVALLQVLALVVAPVFAQEPVVESIPVQEPTAEAPAAATTELEAITVTAQKRVQSLQETPISLEAFNSEKLALRGIEGLHDLAAQVPNMTVEPFPTHNATLRLFIRGVGPTDAQLTQDPAVGIYLDGVYIARSVGLALDIADLERIEVLRGPQGTLYGRNTTGGAVNLITRRPAVDGFALRQTLSFGERGQLAGKTSIDAALTDELGFKLAVLGHRQHGYVENTGPGGDFGDRDVAGLRFDLRWLATDWLTADYAYDHSELDYFNYMYQSVRTPETNKGQAELFKRYGQGQTLYSAERLGALASSAPYEQSGTRIDGQALTLAVPIAALELKYVGSYRDLRDAEYADLGGGAGSTTYRLDSNYYDGPAADLANGGPTPLVIPTVTQEQWTHELQVSGKPIESLQVVAGLFHFAEEAVEDRHRLNHQLSTGLEPEQATAIGVDITAPGFEQARLVNFVDLWWSIDNEATAAYGELTWTPQWLDRRTHWTFGYRHSEDRRDAVKFRISDTYVETYQNGQGSAQPLSSGQPFDNVAASREFRDDSFSYGAAFDLTPAVHVYAKSVEAYKSGGYNVRDPNVDGDDGSGTPQTSDDNAYGFGFVDGFDPEHVRSYELGAKTEWLGRRLRVNGDVFFTDYRDLQINFLVPGTISDTKVRNAGEAEMRGAELDATWLALPRLTFTLGAAYLDTKVEKVINRQTGENEAHLFPFYSAPPYTGVGAVDWTFWDLGWGALRAYASYNYVGERGGLVISEERRGLTRLPAYGLANARLMLQGLMLGDAGALDVALWGRNLADRHYVISAIDNVPHADRAVIWGEPRTVGLEFIYRFD
jgi:iron complex outermembrane recepter protein